MTRGKISSGRRWVHRLFAGWSGPEEIDDVVVLTTPWEGSGRYTDLRFANAQVTAGATVGSLTVPNDQQFWVPYCEAYHDDSALNANLWIEIRDRANNDVTVVGGQTVAADRHISIRRPIIVPEGGRIIASLATTTGAGKTLFLKMFYVPLKLGEYVPPL